MDVLGRYLLYVTHGVASRHHVTSRFATPTYVNHCHRDTWKQISFQDASGSASGPASLGAWAKTIMGFIGVQGLEFLKNGRHSRPHGLHSGTLLDALTNRAVSPTPKRGNSAGGSVGKSRRLNHSRLWTITKGGAEMFLITGTSMKPDISDSNSPIIDEIAGDQDMGHSDTGHSDGAYHEGSELLGMTTLITIILGLIAAGLLMFSLAWALAT